MQFPTLQLQRLLLLSAIFAALLIVGRTQATYAVNGSDELIESADTTTGDGAKKDTTSDSTSDTLPADSGASDTAGSDTAGADTSIASDTTSETAPDTLSDTQSIKDSANAKNDTTVAPIPDSGKADSANSTSPPQGGPVRITPPAPKVVDETLSPREQAQQHYKFAMEYAGDDTKVTEMVGELTLALQADPEYVPALLAMGLYNFERKDYKSAEENLKKAAEFAPHDTTVLDNLGKLYLTLRKRDEAEKVFTSAISANKDFMNGYRQLGDLYYRGKRYDEAISALKKFVAKVNDDPGAHLRIGKAYRKLGKNDKAIEEYKKALQIKNDYAPAYSALGQMYLAEERFTDAVEAYQKSITYNPKAYRSYFNLAVATQSAYPDNLEQSLSAWRQALRMARNNPRVTDIIPIAELQIEELTKQLKRRSKN